MISSLGSARDFWDALTFKVLSDGIMRSPRGRPTLEVRDVQYIVQPHQHFDPRPGRKISLDYVKREFLWFVTGDRYDTRIQQYAPVWKTCIQPDGGINSNYGQYLFSKDAWNAPLWNALDNLAADPDSRRAYVPIFQSAHQTVTAHDDYPCTTGMAFSIQEHKLCMHVTHRSQDLWWGASNDEPVSYLIQLVAESYLRNFHNVGIEIGPILHTVDSLHLYERHLDKANDALHESGELHSVIEMSEICEFGFTYDDLMNMFDDQDSLWSHSPLMVTVLDIPGQYGFEDTLRSW